ncbi:MAG: hypothetical protein Q9169_005077 [Polycauliona sp. 2 TL-2023]
MFEDCQRLQNLRETLLRTLVVLDAQLEIAEGCSGYLHIDRDTEAVAYIRRLLNELGEHSVRLRTHHKAVGNMMIRSQGTLDLMFKILEYRHEEVLRRTNTALQKDIESLRDIAHHTRRENEALVQLAEQSRNDGRALKALSVLGTLYLPATFVAVRASSVSWSTVLMADLPVQTMFSSSLIKAQLPNETENKTHFVPAEQFWLFVVLAGPLMLLTAGYMVWVDRR